MFDNQLDFSGDTNQNYFIFQNNANVNAEENNRKYIEDLRNYQIEGHLHEEYGDLYQNQMSPAFSEQLDYMIQNNVNKIIARETPQPLVYNANPPKNNKNKSNKSTPYKRNMCNSARSMPSTMIKRKKKTHIIANKNSNKIPATNFNVPSNPRGLFDPNLKKNELDFPKKTQLQRLERMDKIKNYDVKFGGKLKKLQMYNNYMDLLEDLENNKAEREFSKKENTANKRGKSRDQLELEKVRREITELEEKLPKPLYIQSNNLDFNFSEQEQLIKSLEEQIERERKMRANVNMKYFQKMKELEELKYNKMLGAGNKSGIINNKTKEVINRYTKKNYVGRPITAMGKKSGEESKYKRELNRSVDLIKRTLPGNKNVRTKSADILQEKMKAIRPTINNMIDKQFNTLFKNVLKKNKTLMKKVYSKSNTNLTRVNDNKKVEEAYNENQYENIQPNCTNNNTYENFDNNYDNQLTNQVTNPFINSNPTFSTPTNHIFLNSSNIENKMAGDIISSQNFDKFQKMNKFQMITSLNQEIEQYNKGLPNLMEKVESTLGKINKVNIFDESTHPIIKLASKHTGQLIHLHIEEILDSIIDDFLFECVSDLQKIEELENKKAERSHFTNFVKDYYHNFESMKHVETEISKKLTSKNYVKYEDKFDNSYTNEDRIKIYEYKNPFKKVIEIKSQNNTQTHEILYDEQRKYKTKIHPNLLAKVESYSRDFNEYMKVTGAFYFPNIFLIYDELINEIVEDTLDQELDYCVRQLDNFVSEVYKEEVFNADLKNIK